jgi:hypothetical protein
MAVQIMSSVKCNLFCASLAKMTEISKAPMAEGWQNIAQKSRKRAETEPRLIREQAGRPIDRAVDFLPTSYFPLETLVGWFSQQESNRLNFPHGKGPSAVGQGGKGCLRSGHFGQRGPL